MAEVTEADIRLADAIAAEYGWSRASDATRERVAAHREAAEKAVIDWLLSEEADWPEIAWDIADAIERGDHRKG